MSKTIRNERKDKQRRKYKREVTPTLKYFEPVTEEELQEFNQFSRMLIREDLELGQYNHR